MFSSKKPFSAVTVQIDQLTSNDYAEDDLSGIPALSEVINLQATGPSEAARALRKKLKYANVHGQLRALTLIDALVQNAGPRVGATFAADDMLLERLRVCAAAGPLVVDPSVQERARRLARDWAGAYGGAKSHPALAPLARLHKQVPQRKHAVRMEESRAVQASQNPFFADEDLAAEAETQQQQTAGSAVASPSASTFPAAPARPVRPPPITYGTEGAQTVQSFSHVKSPTSDVPSPGSTGGFFARRREKAKEREKEKEKERARQIDEATRNRRQAMRQNFRLDEQRPQIKETIADGNIAHHKLNNIMMTKDRQTVRLSDDPAAVKSFEECQAVRKKVTLYIELVQDEELLDTLLHLNDRLINVLLMFETLDKSVEADSDSEDEAAIAAHAVKMAQLKLQPLAAAPATALPSSPGSVHPNMPTHVPANDYNWAEMNVPHLIAAAAQNSQPPRHGQRTSSLSAAPARKPPPPRPSDATKPGARPQQVAQVGGGGQRTRRYYSDEESEEEGDENGDGDGGDPFGDSHAVKG